MTQEINKKKPFHLILEDYRLIEQLINEIPEPELTNEERHLRWKVRLIQGNIEKSIARNIREGKIHEVKS